jgi:Ca2+/Na+ antiporter
MSLAAKQALVCWVAALGVIVAALFAFVGAPGSPDGAGEAIGRVFANTGIAALICWLLARRKTPPWSSIRFALVYVGLVAVLAIVASAGRAQAAEAMLSNAISAAHGASALASGVLE